MEEKKERNVGGVVNATKRAVTEGDCTGDGREQESLCYRFFNKLTTVQDSE